MMNTAPGLAIALSAVVPLFHGAPQTGSSPTADQKLFQGTPGAAPTKRPALVVLLSVDQLIPEQLERLGPDMQGGIGRLLKRGVSIPGAELPYARTETGPGHATLSTGRYPRNHGVVGNTYFDRGTREERYCVEDADAAEIHSRGVSQGRGHRSPKNLLVPTFAELVQRAVPGAQVCSISSKDRAAIGMAGRAQGVVLWWDRSKGTGFISSTAYGDVLPEFVRDWNAGWRPRGRTFVWTETSPVGANPAGAYARWRTAADEREGERPLGPFGVTFPYGVPEKITDESLGGYLFGMPAPDGYAIELALRAVDALELGADATTDVLCLSFSAVDVVGHANGPYSREVTDVLFRLDRGLGALFAQLDDRVGKGRWVAALSSDHGVLPLPEHVRATDGDARRIPRKEVSAMRAAFAKALKGRGIQASVRNSPGGFSLDGSKLAEGSEDPVDARAAASEALRELKGEYPWIHAVYSLEEALALDVDAVGLDGYIARSLHHDRADDITFVTAPGVLLGYTKGTTHGSPHDYDRRIPLLFFGPGAERMTVPPGYVPGSQDVAPTLLDWIGIDAGVPFDGASLLGPE